MCRDSNGGVIEHRQRRRSLAFTQNDLQEQYLRHLEELTSSLFGPILGQVVSMVPGLIMIATRGVRGRMAFAITAGLLALAAITPIVIPASYVAWFHGNARDTGNVIMVETHTCLLRVGRGVSSGTTSLTA